MAAPLPEEKVERIRQRWEGPNAGDNDYTTARNDITDLLREREHYKDGMERWQRMIETESH